MGNKSSSQREALPIETTFKLPADIPVWPQGDGFGKGIIDLGELQVSQISTFTKIWTTFEGGPDNGGATFFEPTSIPQGFFMLGCYCQPNNKPLFGSVLVAKQNNSSQNEPLKKPLDYTLIWTTKSQNIKQDNTGYVWLPTPPDGYKALGHVITVTPEKPSLDKIRCVRSDLTEEAETYSWIWGPGKSSNDSNGFNVYATRPINRGIIQAQGVPIGTFIAQNSASNSTLPLSCLKNTKTNNFSSMPNLPQIKALIQAYSPIVYLHPDEEYLPSSVNWYFSNGALLYKKGEESKPIPVDPSGSNLPQGGDNDGAYWLDLPEDKTNKERVKNGDLQSSQGYIHVKPMFGSTFTDICIWIFYPFNGPSRAKLGLINVSLGKIGEHVGDWEHVTLRISNFNGGLNRVYFSQHSGGEWVDSSELEFRSGTNKPAAYSSLHGHAMYSKPGLVLQGGSTIGIRNDAARSEKVLDLGLGFEIVSGEYLGTGIVVEPPWLNYLRHWGPKISYDLQEELDKVEKVKIEDSLPNELLGEDGPTGPKLKRSWNGDEV
ncbi:Vacuolar protein sorting-associated protein 62 [Senna tora]|uniref:Vacuolar protein sorting-associated protein 62 n=1 Tax=Senna tora TaxID=362788 RepID=A0A834TMA4_9FABA|nr:Vacuolar protein sorting-associated protein 62 [Senna tora]